VLTRCSAVVLKAGKEGQYEREGYGQRPYDNWETIMFDCEGLVSMSGHQVAELCASSGRRPLLVLQLIAQTKHCVRVADTRFVHV
jgi:hypothetical protein